MTPQTSAATLVEEAVQDRTEWPKKKEQRQKITTRQT